MLRYVVIAFFLSIALNIILYDINCISIARYTQVDIMPDMCLNMDAHNHKYIQTKEEKDNESCLLVAGTQCKVGFEPAAVVPLQPPCCMYLSEQNG